MAPLPPIGSGSMLDVFDSMALRGNADAQHGDGVSAAMICT